MQDFEIVKKGYNKEDVQQTIENLIQEYEEKLSEQKERIFSLKQQTENLENQLKVYKNKDQNISSALITAVETAKEIENSSKNIYDLEIKRVRLLYNKWEDFLKEVLEKYPKMKEDFDPAVLLKGFKKAIDQTIKINFNSMQVSKQASRDNARKNIQSLLNKMNSNRTISARSYERNQTNGMPSKTVVMKRNDRPNFEALQKSKADNYFINESRRMNTNNNIKIKPITNLTLSGQDKYDTLVDKYLNTNNNESEEFANSAYSKQLLHKKQQKQKNNYSLYPEPNETGFDLKEALNPTEGLDDIMKAFDFFDSDND